MKIKVQYAIIILSVLTASYVIYDMLQMWTMILPAWLVTIMLGIPAIMTATTLGVIVRLLLNSDWYVLTFVSIFVTIFSVVYIVKTYQPTQKIIISDGYTGTVKMFVTKNSHSNFVINKYGIGYISRKDLDNFNPKIIKNGRNITRETRHYFQSAQNTGSSNFVYKYESFEIPGGHTNLITDIDELIKIGALDTTLLNKEWIPF